MNDSKKKADRAAALTLLISSLVLVGLIIGLLSLFANFGAAAFESSSSSSSGASSGSVNPGQAFGLALGFAIVLSIMLVIGALSCFVFFVFAVMGLVALIHEKKPGSHWNNAVPVFLFVEGGISIVLGVLVFYMFLEWYLLFFCLIGLVQIGMGIFAVVEHKKKPQAMS